MLFEDRCEIDASPEQVWDFFENIEDNYLAWHEDHVLFRFTRGTGVRPGVEVYFEETIGGELLKKTVRYTRIEAPHLIEFVPVQWWMRLFIPKFTMEIEPTETGGSVFIAKIPLRTGPIGKWLGREQFEAVRQHMRDEGLNLKRIVEARLTQPQAAKPVAV